MRKFKKKKKKNTQVARFKKHHRSVKKLFKSKVLRSKLRFKTLRSKTIRRLKLLRRRSARLLGKRNNKAKRRANKLYYRTYRKHRLPRQRMKLLSRAGYSVNLATRSRLFAYLKDSLKRQLKRTFLGYEIEHEELFERNLIVVTSRYKAYTPFESFYNLKKSVLPTRSLSDLTTTYRNDDRFENNFMR